MSEPADLGSTYHDGDYVVREGEPGSCMYVVLDGEAEVVRGEGDTERRLALLEPGDFFGEMALFDGEIRSAGVRALGDVRMLTVDKRTLLARVNEDPTLAFKLLERLVDRVRELNDQVCELERRLGEREDAD
jgi:CRP-like cAMP-binding protein